MMRLSTNGSPLTIVFSDVNDVAETRRVSTPAEHISTGAPLSAFEKTVLCSGRPKLILPVLSDSDPDFKVSVLFFSISNMSQKVQDRGIVTVEHIRFIE